MIDKMYSFSYRIRYSECDSDMMLKYDKIIDLLQDTSTFHSEDVGLGIYNMKEKNLGFIILSWDIIIDDRPRLNEKVKVLTGIVKKKGLYIEREFVILKKDKEIVKAHSIWIVLDLNKVTPIPIDDSYIDKFTLDKMLPYDFNDRKLKSGDENSLLSSFVVDKNMIDSNNHMNNQRYVEKALEYLPLFNKKISRISISYIKEAILNDKICIYIGRDKLNPNKYILNFKKENELKPISIMYINLE